MTFSTLALIVLIGLLGPLLAARQDWHLPILLGELIAGIAFGATGLHRLHAQDSTFSFLADIGFALVMFVAGTHVPVRDPSMRTVLPAGALRAVAVAVISVPLGFAISHGFGTGHPALYAVLIASSSATVILPVIDSLGLGGPDITALLPQVAIADAACIVALPLAIDPSHAGRDGLGALAIIGCGVVFYFALRRSEVSGLRLRLRAVSEARSFALELRISLTILFALAALATKTHVSIMLAGFTLGLAVTATGPPRRLANQLFAITEGFFGPLFFVWLGATLNLRDLWHRPSYIVLGLALGVGAAAAHTAMRLSGQRIAEGALGAAQIGVPIAAATLGAQLHLLKPGEAGALMLGALVTIAIAILAGRRFVATGDVVGPEPAQSTEPSAEPSAESSPPPP
ncbi:MAG TPA: cation:proton antiporter [Micromonosporaceae bacterium]